MDLGDAMPTYAAMGAEVAEEEVMRTPDVRAGDDEGVRGGDLSSGSMGSGRGKGRGSGSGDRRGQSSSGSQRGPQRFQMGSGDGSGSSGGSEWDAASMKSWWTGHHENWSWDRSGNWSNYYSNWEWVKPHDPWAAWFNQNGQHDHSQGSDHGQGHRGAYRQGYPRNDHGGSGHWDGSDQRQGGRCMSAKEVRDMSPTSPQAARDVSGSLPSGETGAVGDAKEPAAAGERKGKASSSYPPIFRAKPGESYKEWRRAVDFWLGGEGNAIPPELVGPRLMVQLRDRAGQLVHHLSNADVNKANGLEVIMKELEKSPIIRQLDRHKVDQHRKKLMQLRRFPQESMESYITRGSIYRTQLQALDKAMAMGEFFYTGLLLDGARVSRKDRVMIKTRAGTDEEEAITNAMIELAPELEGEQGCPIGYSEPNAAARQGDEFMVQRSDGASRFVKKEVNAVEFEGAPWEEWDNAMDEEAPIDEETENLPPEVLQAVHEAYALQFKAKQKIAEVRKLRQYFRKPETAEERKRILAEKMKTSPCHKCGELGHWSRECPNKGHATGATSWKSPTRSSPSTTAVDEWAALVALCHKDDAAAAQSESRYKGRFSVHVVQPAFHGYRMSPHGSFWCHQELQFQVILDLGCVRSVVGVQWMNDLVKEWKNKGRWFRIFPEREQFQFGNMQILTSCFRVHFEAVIAGAHVALAMSVVPGECPPLLSRHACSQLGLNIDCGKHCVSSSRLNVKGFGMSQAGNGHYLLAVNEFLDVSTVDVPEDFKVPEGVEAHVLCPRPSTSSNSDDSSHVAVAGSVAAAFHGSPLERCFSGPSQGRAEEGEGREVGLPTMWRRGTSCSGLLRDGGARGSGGDAGGPGGDEAQAGQGEGQGRRKHTLSTNSEGALQGGGKSRRITGVEQGQRPLAGGVPDDCKAPSEGGGGQIEEGWSEGLDRGDGRLPEPVPRVVERGGLQHGVLPGITHEGLLVEEAPLAAACEKGSGDDSGDPGCAVEAQSTMAGEASRTGSSRYVGPLRSHAPEATQPRGVPLDVMPQRGLAQRLKQGLKRAKEHHAYILEVAAKRDKFVVLEVFAGTARLTRMASRNKKDIWYAMSPIDILSGQDLREKKERDKLWRAIRKDEPDLVTLAMPCGPWCQWMHLCDPEEVADKRTADMPLWHLAREIWDYQTWKKRLVLTEQPLGSEGLRLTFMEERPQLHRAKVAQCMFGSADVVSGKPHRKLTALDVNNEDFAEFLRQGATCMHAPEEHQVLEGKVFFEGRWVNRSWLAGAWPLPLCEHILNSAAATMLQVKEIPHWTLANETEVAHMWEALPVSSGTVPEEMLRQKMGELGVAADRYGYITFEGIGQQVPRRIRSAVAHLHATLGHVSNERLVRMLTMAGAGQQILNAAAHLRCQVCAMVHPPQDAPQVSGSRPTAFNEKLSGDTFYIWDGQEVKYAVIHFVDGLTDYHIADCTINPDSHSAAELLRNSWYGIFGTPDVLVTDGGSEFAGTVETLNQLMGVVHEVVPEGAKWRLGHAERHGAILKVMLMKMVKSHNLCGLENIRMATLAAVMAKNRLANYGGISPLQAVTGKNNVLPASLMSQICSGRMRFVLNNALTKDESLRRSERIRSAAVESYLWLDAHETLRKALASKSRPPQLELLREGAIVYLYDPPSNRKGLARRLQDNSSWSGPGTVICVERDKQVPTRVWVRIRSRVRGVPLERIRLATTEEIVSSQFVTEALEEVQKELTSGKLRLTDEERIGTEPEGVVCKRSRFQQRLKIWRKNKRLNRQSWNDDFSLMSLCR